MLGQAVYCIKTQMGISNSYYQNSEDDPMYGTGQGNKVFPRFGTLTAVPTFTPSTKLHLAQHITHQYVVIPSISS
jgi:hypothetical protein